MAALTAGEQTTLSLLQHGCPLQMAQQIGAVLDAWCEYEQGTPPAEAEQIQTA